MIAPTLRRLAAQLKDVKCLSCMKCVTGRLAIVASSSSTKKHPPSSTSSASASGKESDKELDEFVQQKKNSSSSSSKPETSGTSSDGKRISDNTEDENTKDNVRSKTLTKSKSTTPIRTTTTTSKKEIKPQHPLLAIAAGSIITVENGDVEELGFDAATPDVSRINTKAAAAVNSTAPPSTSTISTIASQSTNNTKDTNTNTNSHIKEHKTTTQQEELRKGKDGRNLDFETLDLGEPALSYCDYQQQRRQGRNSNSIGAEVERRKGGKNLERVWWRRFVDEVGKGERRRVEGDGEGSYWVEDHPFV